MAVIHKRVAADTRHTHNNGKKKKKNCVSQVLVCARSSFFKFTLHQQIGNMIIYPTILIYENNMGGNFSKGKQKSEYTFQSSIRSISLQKYMSFFLRYKETVDLHIIHTHAVRTCTLTWLYQTLLTYKTFVAKDVLTSGFTLLVLMLTSVLSCIVCTFLVHTSVESDLHIKATQ